MSAKCFLDTNIFVYSFDNSQQDKKKCALALIGDALQSGSGMISTQVVQEFLNVATRKFAKPLKVEDSKAYLKMVLGPLWGCPKSPFFTFWTAHCGKISSENPSLWDK